MTTAATALAPATVARKATPHRLGMLFEILDEMGENPTFTFALSRVGDAVPLARADIHHAESDGRGGLTRFLRQHDIRFEPPASRADGGVPPFFERVRAVVRVARHRPTEPLGAVTQQPVVGARREGQRASGRRYAALRRSEHARVRRCESRRRLGQRASPARAHRGGGAARCRARPLRDLGRACTTCAVPSRSSPPTRTRARSFPSRCREPATRVKYNAALAAPARGQPALGQVGISST